VCRACWSASKARAEVEHGGETYAAGKGDVLAAAGGGRSVCLSAERPGDRAGSSSAGMKKLIVYDLDGTLAESKSLSMPKWRDCSTTSSASSKWP
jgi:hypothetical protein